MNPAVATPVNPAVVAVSAFFPCYNDEPTIASMVNVVLGALDRAGIADCEVIVVNDGSTDGSAVVLAELARKEPRLRVVTHEQNRGYGGALLSGFAAATKQWVFYTDGDGPVFPYDDKGAFREVWHQCDRDRWAVIREGSDETGFCATKFGQPRCRVVRRQATTMPR